MDANHLPQSTPEQEGIPSGAVSAFIDYVETRGIYMHSYILVRNGNIASEGYWAPYHKDRHHAMYSVTKTFLSMAIGIMAGEGLISLDDKAVDYFPEKISEGIHPWNREVTLRHLLAMNAMHERYVEPTPDEPDWIKVFLNAQPNQRPGSAFFYDTGGTHTLTGIVERMSGLSLFDYLNPRLLEPMGITKVACKKCRMGISLGGSGLSCTPRDLAKLGVLLINGGRYNGKQLVPPDYVKAATSRQTSNSNSGDTLYGLKGYGYKLWITDDKGFAAYGLGGQFILCLPEQNLVLVTTANSRRFENGHEFILDACRNTILPVLSKTKLPESPDYKSLCRRNASLSIAKPVGSPHSPIAEEVSGKTYRAKDSVYESVCFELTAGQPSCELVMDGKKILIPFSFSQAPATAFPNASIGGNGANTAAWEDSETLVIYAHHLDIAYTWALHIRFDMKNDGVTIVFKEQTGQRKDYNAIVTFELE
jgi:CubicO group peptidase (beta-lactamase class C family)